MAFFGLISISTFLFLEYTRQSDKNLLKYNWDIAYSVIKKVNFYLKSFSKTIFCEPFEYKSNVNIKGMIYYIINER